MKFFIETSPDTGSALVDLTHPEETGSLSNKKTVNLQVKLFKEDSDDDFKKSADASENLTVLETLQRIAKESSMTIVTCIFFQMTSLMNIIFVG